MTPRAGLVVLFALASALAACRDDPGRPAPSSTSASGQPPPPGTTAAAPSPSPSGVAPGDDAADDELSTRPMELLRFRFTTGIDGREPKPEIDHAKPGQRVYAYLAIRNRTGRKRTVTLAWKVNGEPRTTTDLEIDESWQFRTWGYNTVLAKDTKGTVELEVTDDAGHVVVEKSLPIRP